MNEKVKVQRIFLGLNYWKMKTVVNRGLLEFIWDFKMYYKMQIWTLNCASPASKFNTRSRLMNNAFLCYEKVSQNFQVYIGTYT